jgi:predicted nuclease of predicted toxin-antitoxin system
VKFLVDNQLPRALARFIQHDLGCEAIHVCDIELTHASDAAIWRYAATNAYVLITKDEDFVFL